MNATQALLAARAGLVANALLGSVLAAMLLLSMPALIVEGEDPVVIVMAGGWAVLVLGLAVAGFVSAATLHSPVARIAARVVVLAQLVVQFCMCGVLVLPGVLAVWLGLLVSDRERG
ncbi:MAG: hypothetical protein R3F61_07925 [Myxococcota bacterium]